MYSDDFGATWNYSRTLLHPGDESQVAQLPNGSVVMNMRGHDLPSYDHGNANNARRWLGRSDDGGTTWPAEHIWVLPNLTFGGDCEGSMVALPRGDPVLIMSAIHSDGPKPGIVARASVAGSIIGRADLRLHRSIDGGASWQQVAVVYQGSAAYSSLVALNATHVGVLWAAGSLH
eukprot:CAMPEP_0206305666 /NCGR_PEP_ID=MMETSP0106_2-20121207/10388_1 /ASSEMBLY_ACC=CAM_ASM_000206 /TAXON_ID=81532 /ORGANISM="Acanthoeca-like sp., Strain 10tr" /LENGTH=174 /DNA_ID=CAMNT_0053736535 /DNA_START=1 /DNA_END=522 /DNA_ORIENTATION=+